jgi:ribonuclease P protein subunit RPR2
VITASNVDVVVIVAPQGSLDPCEPVRTLNAAGLQERVLVIADDKDLRTAAECLQLGVAGYILRGAAVERLVGAVTQVAAHGIIFDRPAAEVLHHQLVDKEPVDPSAMSAARALAAALEFKDTYTGGHAERVTTLAMRLARIAMLAEAPPTEGLEAAFLLHDVGKIGIPESILNKPGGLTDTERRVLQTHPILGERIIAPLGFPQCVRDVVRHHHERWDGHGYPDGLAAEQIPAAARLFTIADVIDAMTSIRPYRRPVSFEAAIEEVLLGAGKQFDPQLAALAEDAFLDTPVELLKASTLYDKSSE